jgi:hypothetical protein
MHNSDLTRLKGVTSKDIIRMEKYAKFYNEIQEKLGEDTIHVGSPFGIRSVL